MDKTDILLSMLLLENSRKSYRDLAEKLNLSANAVHQRIQALIHSGVIRKFTAKISLIALRAVIVVIYGVSDAESVNTVRERIGGNSLIYWVAYGGGNWVYIGAYLRNLSDLQGLVDFLKKEARMANPTVGIFPPTPASLVFGSEQMLSPLDRQIIFSLKDDSRKSISDVAEELGIAAKTVRRRISAMQKKGLIEFSIHWYADSSNDIITIMHIKLNREADLNSLSEVMKAYFPNVLFWFPLINIPNEVYSMFWTSTMKELKEIQQRLANERIVSSVSSNILFTGFIFDTWRDELVLPASPSRN